MLERMKAEQDVNVYLAVRSVSRRTPQFFTNMVSQYYSMFMAFINDIIYIDIKQTNNLLVTVVTFFVVLVIEVIITVMAAVRIVEL